MRDTVLGMCNLHSPPQEHKPVSTSSLYFYSTTVLSVLLYIITTILGSVIQVVSLLANRFMFLQAASVGTEECTVGNTSSMMITAGSVTPCHKRTLITGDGHLDPKML